jgi:hypothetical protein
LQVFLTTHCLPVEKILAHRAARQTACRRGLSQEFQRRHDAGFALLVVMGKDLNKTGKAALPQRQLRMAEPKRRLVRQTVEPTTPTLAALSSALAALSAASKICALPDLAGTCLPPLEKRLEFIVPGLAEFNSLAPADSPRAEASMDTHFAVQQKPWWPGNIFR